ncbi:MAG: metal-binding protein [Flavobacteriales bacterium]|nr:metal-binding protein [Flavobacteriales bacterium]
MIRHLEIDDVVLHQKIKLKEIIYGGNSKLKIYGTLQCKSGKRMKKENRVFFNSVQQTKTQGYRPCGNCLIGDYQNWKDGLI